MPDGHILIVAPSAYPLGGVATWIDYIVPGLRQRGWQVTLGLTEGTLHNVNAYLAAHPMQGVVRIRNRTGTHEGRVRSLCAAITAVRPDIVASVNIPDVYSAVNRLKRSGFLELRAVMTLHAIEAEYFEQIKRCAAVTRCCHRNQSVGMQTGIKCGRARKLQDILRPLWCGSSRILRGRAKQKAHSHPYRFRRPFRETAKAS